MRDCLWVKISKIDHCAIERPVHQRSSTQRNEWNPRLGAVSLLVSRTTSTPGLGTGPAPRPSVVKTFLSSAASMAKNHEEEGRKEKKKGHPRPPLR